MSLLSIFLVISQLCSFDTFNAAQAKLLLSIKTNDSFHLSYYYSAMALDKISLIKAMRGSTTVDIADTAELALEKINKTLALHKTFSSAHNLGREISRKMSQMLPENADMWLAKAAEYGENSKRINPTMENCLLLGAIYVDQALRIDNDHESARLEMLRKAEETYLQGMRIYVQSSKTPVLSEALPLIVSPPTDLKHIWEFLVFDDEPTHTQALDIMQRLAVHSM